MAAPPNIVISPVAPAILTVARPFLTVAPAMTSVR